MHKRHTVLTTAATLTILSLPLGLAAQQDRLLPMEGQGGWGYVDLTGAWVIPPQFRQATRFSEGRALVLEGRSWHFIDETGENTIGHRFDSHGSSSSNDIEISWPGASLFSEGLAAAYIPFTGHAVIRADGEIAFEFDGPLQVGLPYSFREGLAVAYTERLEAGYIDDTGAWVIPPAFQRARPFSEGLAAARDDETDRWGYIDRSGSWVIEPQFYEVGDFSSGLAPVSHESFRWAGYIDRSGELVIAGDFRRAAPFGSGLARVSDGEGSYFIDTDGVRVLDEASLEPFCYTDSFVDGLALVVIATEEGCDFMSSSSGDMAFVQPIQGLLGYIDTTGSVVVRQPQAERDAMIAERRRAEQAVLDTEAARLAACPDVVEYGEPGSGNYLVIHREGKRRILHLAEPAVHRADNGTLSLRLPGFGRDEVHQSMTTNLSYGLREREDAAGEYHVSAYRLGSTAPRLDCISLPEDLLRQRGVGVRFSAFTLPGPDTPGRAKGVIGNPARSADEDGIEFHFDTSQFSGFDVTELSSGWHAGATIEQASIVHDPTRRTLSIETPGADGAVSYALSGFGGDTGLHYQRRGSRLHIFDVSRFGDGGAAIDVFEMDITDFVEEEQTSFFTFGADQRLRDRYAPDPADRVLSLAATTFVREPYLPPLVFTPVASAEPPRAVADDRDPEVRPAHALFASMFSGPRQNILTIDDLPPRVNQDLPPLQAHDWPLKAAGTPLVVRETSGPADGATWRISVEASVEEEVAEAPEAADPIIAKCHDLAADLERLGREVTDEAAANANAIRLIVAAGFTAGPGAGGAVGPDAIFEAFYETCAPAFETMYDEMFGDHLADMAAEMGLQLTIDAASGAPLRRSFASKDTRIEVEYRGGYALLTAENEGQGRHEAQIAVPEGILDIAQLHSVLAALSLAQGYARELFFLAVVPGTSRTTEVSLDGSGLSSSQRTRRTVDPRFVRVVLMVDRVEAATEAFGEEAYVVKVGVEPEAYGTWSLGINPPLRDEGIGYVLYHIGRESRALLAIEHADGITVRRIDGSSSGCCDVP